jgi:flagellar protein FlbD
MIRLTRLNRQPIGLNCDLIKFIENTPDTTITLLNGEKILVRETYEEIVAQIVAFRQRVLAGLPAGSLPAAAAVPSLGETRPEASSAAPGTTAEEAR